LSGFGQRENILQSEISCAIALLDKLNTMREEKRKKTKKNEKEEEKREVFLFFSYQLTYLHVSTNGE